MKRVSRGRAMRTSLQGYVRVSYARLVKSFGKPLKGDGYKTDAEWVLKAPDGTIATIYNYKDGKAYLGRKGKPVSKITDWHIGGKKKAAVAWVKKSLK